MNKSYASLFDVITNGGKAQHGKQNAALKSRGWSDIEIRTARACENGTIGTLNEQTDNNVINYFNQYLRRKKQYNFDDVQPRENNVWPQQNISPEFTSFFKDLNVHDAPVETDNKITISLTLEEFNAVMLLASKAKATNDKKTMFGAAIHKVYDTFSAAMQKQIN
jgi:hypothetical protein